jgi:TRAP-type C4-dicarboxylate transport system permease small subunit
MEKVKESLYGFFKLFVSFTFISMVLMIFVNAVLRYVFNSGISATEELSRYAFVWVSGLGAILGYWQNKHVGVDMLVNSLHGIPKLLIQIIAELIVLYALYILIYGGWRYFVSTINLDSAAIPIPMGIITVTPFVMGVAMAPKTLLLIRDHFIEYKTYKAKKEGGDL